MKDSNINELPHNADAEKALIGLTFLRQQIPHGAKVLATTDFYSPDFRNVWSACLELEEERQQIDALSVNEVLKREFPGTAAQWSVSSLMNLIEGAAPTNEQIFVKKIRSASVRRYLIRKLNNGIQSLIKGDKGVIQDLRRDLNEIEFAEDLKGNFISIGDVITKEVKPALYDLQFGRSDKIPTGFEAIDRVIGGGISLSDVMLIAGLPGGGKSALVLQIASNLVKQGLPVAYLSGEMSNKENVFRMLSQFTGTQNLNSKARISSQEVEFYYKWADSMIELPLYLDCRTYDLRSLATSLRSLVDEKGIKCLVIDYIQLFKLNRFDRQGRTERVAEASQEVKRLAMEYGIAVIEVAQFNREGMKSGKPQMHDLEASSQLEKDTSLIFIIDHEEGSQNVGLRIVKGRNSGTSEIAGRFEGYKLTFEF